MLEATLWSRQDQHAAGYALLRVLADTFVLTLKYRELIWMSSGKLAAESIRVCTSQHRYLNRSIDALAARITLLVQEPLRVDPTQLQAMSAIDDNIAEFTIFAQSSL